MVSNLSVDNNYNIFCNTLTAKQVISENKPPVNTVTELCICTTLSGASSPTGTANDTVAQTGIIINYTVSNGICFLYKTGSSGAFPDASQSATLKTNIESTNTLYLLARIPGSQNDSGGIFIPPNTFPLVDSVLSNKQYYGYCNFIFPSKQLTLNPILAIQNPVMFNFVSNNPSGQYFEIIIPRNYDYINSGGSYTEQKFSGDNGANIMPAFYVQYPTDN